MVGGPVVIAGNPGAVRFGLLGPLQVVDGGGRAWPVQAAKQRIVLAALLLGSGSVISADRMADALWDVSAPANGPAVMRNYVMRLRRTLGPVGTRVVRQPPGWAIALQDGDELDLTTVEGLWHTAKAAVEARNWKLASQRLAEALSHWRGEPLIDVPSPVLARREAVRLGELRLALTEARIDAQLQLGRHFELVAELRRLAAEHPLREHLRLQLMLACFRSGSQAEALDVYRDTHRTLTDELGVAPGPELRNLHQRILAGDPDLLVSAADTVTLHDREIPAGYLHGLPPATAAFAGRDAEVRVVTTGLAGSGAIRVISGMPGVGKTALALHAAHLLAPVFPDRQVFIDLHGHTPGRNPVSAGAALAELITATGVDASFLPADVAGRSAMWRDRLAGQRAVLVLDNAASSAQIAPLLPGSGDCLVLVTSRRQLADLPGAVTPVRLTTLSRRAARAMFVTLTPRAAREDVALVDELTALAGHLPLAITLLARVHAGHPSWALSDLIAETRAGLLAMTAERASVGAAFGISWRHLRPGQRRLLAALSLHPGTSADEHAAAALAGVPVSEATWLLDRLHHECLLTETGYRRYRLHDLIRSYAAAQARDMLSSAETAAAVRRLLDYYADTAARSDLAWLRAERANLLACLDYAAGAGWPAQVVSLTTAMAALLRRDGPWPQAERLHAAAVQAARGLGDRAALARCLLELAVVRRLTSNHLSASQDLSAALDIHRALGDRVGEAAALLELSHLRTLASDFDAASRFAEQALSICRETRDRLGQARALTMAGSVLRRTADVRAAGQVLTEAVTICRELGDQAGLAFALRQLGDVLRLTSQYAAAEACLSESIELSRVLQDRLGQANALAWLGGVRWQTGDCRAAIGDLEQALRLQCDLGNRLGQANALSLLGDLRHSAGDFPDAIRDLQRALNLHYDIGNLAGQTSTLGRLGKVRIAIGDYQGARTDLGRAISIARKLGDLGAEATILTELANLRFWQEDITAARLDYQQALQLARRITSPWDEAHALVGLGRCAKADGDTPTASGLLTQAHRIFHRIGAAAEAADVAAERDLVASTA